MSVDVTKIKKHAKVKLKDGRTADVRGAYMSPQGIVLMVKQNLSDSIVTQNVLIADVEEVVADGK